MSLRTLKAPFSLVEPVRRPVAIYRTLIDRHRGRRRSGLGAWRRRGVADHAADPSLARATDAFDPPTTDVAVKCADRVGVGEQLACAGRPDFRAEQPGEVLPISVSEKSGVEVVAHLMEEDEAHFIGFITGHPDTRQIGASLSGRPTWIARESVVNLKCHGRHWDVSPVDPPLEGVASRGRFNDRRMCRRLAARQGSCQQSDDKNSLHGEKGTPA